MVPSEQRKRLCPHVYRPFFALLMRSKTQKIEEIKSKKATKLQRYGHDKTNAANDSEANTHLLEFLRRLEEKLVGQQA